MYSPADFKVYNVKTKKVIEEKSLVAYELQTNKIIAIGNEVYHNLENYNPNRIVVSSPFHQGSVDDFTVAEKFMRWVIVQACGKKRKSSQS